VNDVLSTRNGELWIATAGGLAGMSRKHPGIGDFASTVSETTIAHHL
jgi:hypothetical protein